MTTPLQTESSDLTPRVRRIALVTHGYLEGGGVPAMTDWMRDQIRKSEGYSADVHVLATSSRDTHSRQIRRPSSWQRPLGPTYDASSNAWYWGANATEIEFMRYTKRARLTTAMSMYDLIHVVCGAPGWATPVIGIGVPVVLHFATLTALERETAQGNESRIAIRTWRSSMTRVNTVLERRALRRADAVLTINKHMLQHVKSLGQGCAFNAVPGTDTSVFVPNSAWDRRGYLLSVCRFGDPRKGLERMVNAYALLVERDQYVPNLVLAGRGTVPSHLLNLIETLGLGSRIVVRENVAASELPAIFRNASVYLQTSYEEGLGIAVVEAMASGIPTVATKTAGTVDTVIDSQTGWLIEQGADDLVARRIADRVAATLASNVGELLATNARRRAVAEFSQAVTFATVTQTYDEVLNRGLVGHHD